MSGLEPVIIGSLISAGAGAASAEVQGKKQRRANQRISDARLRAQKETQRSQRIASAKEIEDKRQTDVSTSRLTKAKSRQIISSQLAQKGIKGRPSSNFSDISRLVLDEGGA